MGAVLSLIGLILNVFVLLLLARALLSYFPQMDYNNPLVRAVYNLTEPVLRPVRNAIKIQGPVDWSPVIVVVAIYLIRTVLRI
jgi:YggT family protein